MINNPKRISSHSFGSLKIDKVLYLIIPLLLLAPTYCYYKAVSTKQERPFPHATITNTACHYPQDIVFRFVMLSAGCPIVLVYFIISKWMAYQKRRTGYPGDLYSWLMPLSFVSIPGFYAAIGTIDGAGYPDIHTVGAVFFFIVLFVLAFISTLVLADMRAWDTTVISSKSLMAKVICVGYLTAVAIYFLIGLVLEGNQQNDDDIYVVIMEWNLVYIGLIWLGTFVFDWGHVYVTLRGNWSVEEKEIESQ